MSKRKIHMMVTGVAVDGFIPRAICVERIPEKLLTEDPAAVTCQHCRATLDRRLGRVAQVEQKGAEGGHR